MKYVIQVEKMVRANVEVEAENLDDAHEKAQEFKHLLHLNWK